ncbi:MAG: HEPN domain-containing protein [Candidatus Binatia bacterium]
MKDRLALARGWIRKGDSDLADARRTVASEGPYDTACFHVQQAAEKYLKALPAWHGQAIPRSHDLEEIQDQCERVERLPALVELDLADLTGYAVELRYDADFWPDQSTAAEAVALAERVRSIVISVLPADPPETG